MLLKRCFSSVRRARPFALVDVGAGVSQVKFSPRPQSLAMGQFATNQKAYFEPAFTLEPNPRDEPEVLLQKPDAFTENPQFWPRAAALLKQHIHECPVYSDLAAGETRTQFFHIYDLRLPPVFGRIPEVEDILGTVELRVEDGAARIVPYSFQENSMYRPVTQYGGMLVSPHMFDMLARELHE